MRRDNRADKIGGKAFFRIRSLRPRHNRHGDLGEIIENDKVEVALGQKLRQREVRLAPITRCTAYPNHTVCL